MEATTALAAVGLGVGFAGVVGLAVHFSRSRARVMDYHHISTPRVNEATHGGGGGD